MYKLKLEIQGNYKARYIDVDSSWFCLSKKKKNEVVEKTISYLKKDSYISQSGLQKYFNNLLNDSYCKLEENEYCKIKPKL